MSAKAAQLRTLLNSQEMCVIMEAHNGLSARLVEEAGFQAIWASGLAISCSLGVRDCNEASWTQVLEVLEFMEDATDLPILLDGDTGYGNFNNVRRLVKKLSWRGSAGVCLEDKVFPKKNSFANGQPEDLVDVNEFAGKIRAAKDSQRDDNFVVVARTEAYIVGRGTDEAIDRASRYAEAGADAILVHSKRSDSNEIEAFMARWNGCAPIIVVPTTYSHVPLRQFSVLGISNVIFANHAIRTVAHALEKNLRLLRTTLDLSVLEGKVATVEELFRLQNMFELEAAEKRYLPGKAI
ncbi:phosphoenolpyruvate mutase [Rhizobium ruizarguesonis]|uniref:phosphoenolpyruvate mutase n=1 Tax=Rhizobium ruizarguesonis TaxID=2081791 RepID=UPI00103149CF|nr:phosphoenolpyruvate mutase [Rhizobium ruizarguesonis]MBY5856077.1 phosphoenolpyruvate mutase [Rhizobium leguminosarum]TBA74483.1 phosphoenolpyruvate mutase [Rhizobium ruizarguesonis]